MEEDFKTFLEKERKIVNENINEFFTETIEHEEEPFLREFLAYGQHFVIQGGRRLHPICLLETYKGLSSERDILDNKEEVYKISVAVELLHISNLMIDDLIDNEEFRRGKKTFHRMVSENITQKHKMAHEYETASAIYGGNLTSLFGARIISESKFDSKRKSLALKTYINGLSGVTRSHLLDEYYKQQDSLDAITLENYLILADRRAKQMETAVALGAIFGNARKSQLQPLMRAMNKIGIIEQIQNDLNGTFGDPELHSIDSDIISGQRTILTIVANQNANPDQKKILNSVLGNYNAKVEEINSVRTIFKDTGAANFADMYCNSLKNEVYNELKQVYPGLRQTAMAFYGQLLSYITEYKG